MVSETIVIYEHKRTLIDKLAYVCTWQWPSNIASRTKGLTHRPEYLAQNELHTKLRATDLHPAFHGRDPT